MARFSRRRKPRFRWLKSHPLLSGVILVAIALVIYQFSPQISEFLKTQIPIPRVVREDRLLVKYEFRHGLWCYDTNTSFCERDYIPLLRNHGVTPENNPLIARTELGYLKSHPGGQYVVPIVGCISGGGVYLISTPYNDLARQTCDSGARARTLLGYVAPTPETPNSPAFFACNHSNYTNRREECRQPIFDPPLPFSWRPIVGYFMPPQAPPRGFIDRITATQVSGWSCDTDEATTPVIVEVWADGPPGNGTQIGEIAASEPGEAAIGNYCNGQRNHRFNFIIPELWRAHAFYMYARDVGTRHDPVLLGNSVPSPPKGRVDHITATQITGYACDLDDTTRKIGVHFYVDGPAGNGGRFVAGIQAGEAGGTAVALECGGDGDHYFTWAIPAQWRGHTFHVYAINIGTAGNNVLIGNSIPNTPRGRLLGVEHDVVSGYACDLDDSEAAISVHVYADGPAGAGGTFIGDALANQSLPDQFLADCGGQGNHRYEFEVPDPWQGHAVYVYAINIGTVGVNPLIGNTTPNPPKGFVDNVNPTGISGWACDPDRWHQPLQVKVFMNGDERTGQLIHTLTADQVREDLVSHCGGHGNHGFSVALTPAQAGRSLHVYAINIGSPNPNVLIGTYTPPVGGPAPTVGPPPIDPGPPGTLAALCLAVLNECNRGNQIMCQAYQLYCPQFPGPGSPLPPPPPSVPPSPSTGPLPSGSLLPSPTLDPDECMRDYCASLEVECARQGYQVLQPGDVCAQWGACVRGEFDIPPQCRPGGGSTGTQLPPIPSLSLPSRLPVGTTVPPTAGPQTTRPPRNEAACLRWWCGTLENLCRAQGGQVFRPGDVCDQYAQCARGDFGMPAQCPATAGPDCPCG